MAGTTSRCESGGQPRRSGTVRLLPNVGLSAGANRTHVDIHTSVPLPGMASSFNNTQQNVQLSAQQPLYRPANKIAYEQGQRGVDVAQAQLDAAAQT
jgi:outer membrane protein